MNYVGDISCVSFGSVMCLILEMLWRRSLCRSLKDVFEFKCGNIVEACVIHSDSSSVIYSWRFWLVLLRCILPAFLKRNSVRVVGEWTQSWYFIRGICSAPPYLAKMYWISP